MLIFIINNAKFFASRENKEGEEKWLMIKKMDTNDMKVLYYMQSN